jgi:transposase
LRFIGIDIGSQKHAVAAVDERGEVVLAPLEFTEDVEGYEKLLGAIGPPEEALVAMEGTGHYWRNLFAHLAAAGFQVALLNPFATRRFAESDLERTKTDAIDAVSIARFAQQKRPRTSSLPDDAGDDLRELVRLRDRAVQDLGDKVRQLHRALDLCFPEFTRHVRTLQSHTATAILREYPTAASLRGIHVRRLAKIRYDERHRVGEELAAVLLGAAAASVAAHHGEVYQLQVRLLCDDIDVLRERVRDLDSRIEKRLDDHEIGKLLTSIEGVGTATAARLVAETGGDPARFRTAGELAAYVGVVPALRHSGTRTPLRAGITHMGNARLRAKLWMTVLGAVRRNPWLRGHYERLLARGKLRKVALVACMHKLLIAVHWVARHRRPFIAAPAAQSAEVLA